MPNNDPHIILDKELRRDIDAIIQRLLNDCKPQPGAVPVEGGLRPSCRSSRERSLAYTHLQTAVMWLGMDLKAINDENPQPAPSLRSLAIDAYTRYGVATGGKNFKGDQMPSFDDLGETIQKAWEAAVSAPSGANPYPHSKDPSNTVIDKTADGLKM